MSGGATDYLTNTDDNAANNELYAPLEVGHLTTPRPKDSVL